MLAAIFTTIDEIDHVDPHRIDREELTAQLQEEALALYDRREQELSPEVTRDLERFLLLEIIDQRWREHLYDLDYLQQGIHLRGFAQIEPLVAYKNEAFELFRDLMNSIWDDYARLIFHVEVTPVAGPNGDAPPPQRRPSSAASSPTGGGRVTYSGGGAPQGALAIAAAAGGATAGDVGALPPDEPAPLHVEQRRV